MAQQARPASFIEYRGVVIAEVRGLPFDLTRRIGELYSSLTRRRRRRRFRRAALSFKELRNATLLVDHLVIAAMTLEEGVEHVRKALGVTVPQGGAHPLMGTHNRLMKLDDGLFLEVIAPDPAAKPHRPRWFALDDSSMRAALLSSPRLITWVARVLDLATTLASIPASLGEIVKVSRGALQWVIAVPPDGSMPFGGAFPTIIQWPRGPHPASGMADLGCSLHSLTIEHPEADRIRKILAPAFSDCRIAIREGAQVRLSAQIVTPAGLRELT